MSELYDPENAKRNGKKSEMDDGNAVASEFYFFQSKNQQQMIEYLIQLQASSLEHSNIAHPQQITTPPPPPQQYIICSDIVCNPLKNFENLLFFVCSQLTLTYAVYLYRYVLHSFCH